MEEESIRAMAQQLRKPEGDMAEQVSLKMNQLNAEMNIHAISILNPQTAENILEIGMGNGYFVKDILAKSPYIRYSGVDYSQEMIKEASLLNKESIKKGKVDFSLGTASNLDFKDNTFHKALSVNTIYFWKNPEEELNEIKRVLKNKGELILGFRPSNNMLNFPFTKYNFNLYSEDELLNLLKENGFINTKLHVHQEEDLLMEGKKYEMQSMAIKAVVQK